MRWLDADVWLYIPCDQVMVELDIIIALAFNEVYSRDECVWELSSTTFWKVIYEHWHDHKEVLYFHQAHIFCVYIIEAIYSRSSKVSHTYMRLRCTWFTHICMHWKLAWVISRIASFGREEVYGRWNRLPASRVATSLTIIWWLPIVDDQIERPPILYLLSFIL